MTHYELLEELNYAIQEYDNAYDNTNYYYTALRTVLELHKPTSTNDTIFCNVCWAISEEHNLKVMPVVYPCPTIQGIEEELE